MIAVDTSAIVAIVFGEPERAAFRQAIMQARKALISTASALEVRMVVYSRRGPRAMVLVDDMLRLPMFEITPPRPEDLDAAFGAFLAFGDLFSYALAKVRNLPLLFKGADFAETDIRAVETAA
jgi:ribonuclease VapC